MKRKVIYTLMLLFITINISAGRKVRGTVRDENGSTIDGALVKLDKTSIGTTTFGGYFELGIPDSIKVIILSCSLVGFKNQSVYIPDNKDSINIILKENVEQLGEVVVSSSRYSRIGNYSGQVTKLNAFDVYTNPQALGDIIGGLKILPSVQTNDTDGRLIIQGGSTDESQIFVDGLLVYNPFTLSQKNVGVRSRFSPDIFRGVSLFTGGYTSEYGQALSGILELNTVNKEDLLSKTDINLNSTGVELSLINNNNKKNAYRINTSYTDMTPYGKIFTDSYKWHRYYNQISGDIFFYNEWAKNTKMKTQIYYSRSGTDYSYNNTDSTFLRNNLKESYFMISSTLNHKINKHNLYIGANLTSNTFTGTEVNFATDSVRTKNIYSHVKIADSYSFNKNTSFTIGIDNMYNKFQEDYYLGQNYKLHYNNNITSVFGTLSLIKERFTTNISLRTEYYSRLKATRLSPRLYLGYRLSLDHTLAFSSGIYYQNPNSAYLKFTDSIKPQESLNSSITYNYVKASSKFSIDVFYKKYKQLVSYENNNIYLTNITNIGKGYAYGLNAFWKHNIKTLEYWVSYSYINSKIKNLDFLYSRQPEYISPHSFRLTTKYWVSNLKSMIGLSFHIDSGSIYSNPTNKNINKTTPYRSKVDFSWSYLPKKGIIIHLGCQNILGRKNIYGYNYSLENMNFKSISTPNPRFFYLGVFITLSKLNLNQLKSL